MSRRSIAVALLVSVILVGSIANLFPILISSPGEHAAFTFNGGGILESAFFKANSTRELTVSVYTSELGEPSGNTLCTASFPPVNGLGVAHFQDCALEEGDYFLVMSDASASPSNQSIVYYAIGNGTQAHYFDGSAWHPIESSASTLTLSWAASASPTPQPTPGLAEVGTDEPLYMEIDDYLNNQTNATSQTFTNVTQANQTLANATNQTTVNQTIMNTTGQVESVETAFDRDSFLAALPEGVVTRAKGAPFLRKFFSSPEYKAERLGPLVLSSKKIVQCAIQSDCMAEFVLYNDGDEDLEFPLSYSTSYSLPASGEEFSVATNWSEGNARIPLAIESNESSYANETRLNYSYSPSQVLSVPAHGSTVFRLSFRIPDYARGDFNLTLSTPFGALEYDPTAISGCGAIASSDYYVLKFDISGNGNCLDIRANDVTIDCKGKSISGNGSGYGVYVDRHWNVSVVDCEIKNFSTAVYYFGDNTDDCTLTGNTVWNNSADGFYLEDGDHNDYGGNNASYNGDSGFKFTGSASADTVKGGTVIYNTNGLTVNSDDADNLIVYTSKFAFNTKRGITSTDGDSNNYSYNNVSYNLEHGIYFLGSTTLNNVSWNDVIGNSIVSKSYHGIYFNSDDVDYNTFDNNSVENNGGVEVYLAGGDSNVFYNNTIIGDQCVNLSATADSNSFYHNYLSKCTQNNFVSNKNSTNNFNTTVGGVAQGNYYDDISSYSLFDSDSDGFGDTGPDYPYDSDMNYWFGVGADYGPINANETVGCQVVSTDLTLNVDVDARGYTACFNLTANGVTLDCAGHIVYGSGAETGVFVEDTNDTRVENCVFADLNYGVHIDPSYNNTVIDSVVYSSGVGLWLQSSHNNTIQNVTVMNSSYEGIVLNETSTYNSVYNSTSWNNTRYGVYLQLGNFNNVSYCNVSDNTNIGVKVVASNNSVHDNIVTGGTATYCISTMGNYNNISYNNASYCQYGISPWSAATQNTFIGNTLHDNSDYGFFLNNDGTDYNTVYDNSMYSNGKYGVYFSYAGYNNVSYNNISYNTQHGVYLIGSSTNNNISWNNVTGNSVGSATYHGISLYSDTTDYNTVDHNTIDFNGGNGILLTDADYNSILHNIVPSNDQFGIRLGVSATSSSASGNVISWNKISGTVSYDGIYISGEHSDNNTIYNNSVELSGRTGISTYYSDYNNFSYNNASYNLVNGFTLLSEISFDNVSYNNVLYNTQNGIILSGVTANNNCSYNNISYNTRHGVSLTGTATSNNVSWNNVTGNSVGSPSYDGINLYSDTADYNTFDHNTIDLNGRHGFYLRDGDSNVITDNNVSYNTQHGAYLRSLNDTWLEGNSIRYNSVGSLSYHGVYTVGADFDYNTLYDNRICDNGGYGVIVAGGGDYNNFSYNNFSSNTGGYGLYLAGGAANNNVTGNDFFWNNGGFLLQTDTADYNTIYDNTFFETGSSCIYNNDGDYNNYSYNNISGCASYGIRFANSATFINITGNDFADGTFGFYAADAGTQNFTVKYNSFTGYTHGAYFDDADYLNFSYNNASYNSQNGFYSYSNSDNNTFIENDLIYNTWSGLHLYGSDGNNVSYNNASYNTRHGVYLASSSVDNNVSWNNITGNSVGSSSYDGVSLDSDTADLNTIDFNTVDFNGRYGVYLDDDDYNNVSYNNVSYNADSGIRLAGSTTNNNVSWNNVTWNTNAGIYPWGASVQNNTFSYNTVYKNANGFRPNACSSNEISYNNVSWNSRGVYFSNTVSNVNISYNVFNNNTNQGIYSNVDTVDNNTISFNEIAFSGTMGLYINHGDYNNLSYNNVSYNTQHGVYFTGSATNNNVSWNNLTENGASSSYYNLYADGDDVDYNTFDHNTFFLGYIGAYSTDADYNNYSYNNFSYLRWEGGYLTGSSTNNNYSFNTFQNNTWDYPSNGYPSLRLTGSGVQNNTIYHNTIYNGSNYGGVVLFTASYNNVSYNDISAAMGLYVTSHYNNVSGNSFKDGGYTVLLGGNAKHNTVFNNTMYGGDNFALICDSCQFNNFSYNNLSYSSEGFQAWHNVSYNLFAHNLYQNNYKGIDFGDGAVSNTVYNNTIHSSSTHGVYFYGNTSYNNLSYNNISYNTRHGVYLNDNATNNNFSWNTIRSNSAGSSSYHGVYLNSINVDYNTFNNNSLKGNGGVGVSIASGDYNVFYNNSIVQSQSVNLSSTTSYNEFYHNYFSLGSNNFVHNDNSTNEFNTTVSGAYQGNYYADILDWAIYDADADGFGESGYEYPYNSDMTYWFGEGADYGPINAAKEVSCRTLEGNVTLFNDVTASGDCFIMGADNIWLDCDGYSITGDETGDGVNNTGYENVTVKNCFIQNFSRGAYWAADYGNLENDTLYDNEAYGLEFYSALNNSLWDSNASYNQVNALFNSSKYNEVFNSTIDYGSYGFLYEGASEAYLLNTSFNYANFSDADSNHSVAWLIDFYSIDSHGGAVASAELNLSTNIWWNPVWSGTTNATGGSGNWLNITSYFEDTNGVVNYSDHLMRAFKSDYLSEQAAVDTSTHGAKQILLSNRFTRAYGDSLFNVTLADDGGDAVFNWSAIRAHAFAYDYDFTVNWNGLQALGRNATGEAAHNDLAQADTALGLTGYLDSLANSYGSETANLTFYGLSIDNVLVVNSSNSSSLLTGVLWDASGGGEYDGSQDLVFVAPISLSAQGLSGVVDYELLFPANLSNCSGATNQVSLELRTS